MPVIATLSQQSAGPDQSAVSGMNNTDSRRPAFDTAASAAGNLSLW
jgi:hypothetical protein